MYIARLVKFLALTMCVAASAAEKPDSDKEKIKGSWQFVSSTEGGQETKLPSGMTVVITDSLLTTRRPGQDLVGGKYMLDPTQKPRQIDLSIEETRGHPIVQKGIYDLQGDTLRIHLAVAGQPRPTDFEAKAGDSGTVWVLKRVTYAAEK